MLSVVKAFGMPGFSRNQSFIHLRTAVWLGETSSFFYCSISDFTFSSSRIFENRVMNENGLRTRQLYADGSGPIRVRCMIYEVHTTWCIVLQLDTVSYVRDHLTRISEGSFDRRASIHDYLI